MTIEDLKNQILLFGDVDMVTSREQILNAANLALKSLYIRIPVLKTVTLSLQGSKPTLYYERLVCRSGESITLPLQGKAFSARVFGQGNYYISDGGNVEVIQFNSEEEPLMIRRFISRGGSIKFWSSFTFTIYDFAVFDDIFSAYTEGIPTATKTVTIDMRERYEDFLAFVGPPKDSRGNILDLCSIQGSNMELSSSYAGEISITYRRLPTAIVGTNEADDANEMIDIQSHLIHAFLMLTLYYFWLNTDGDKASLYKSQYESLLDANIDGIFTYSNKYVDVNGWS